MKHLPSISTSQYFKAEMAIHNSDMCGGRHEKEKQEEQDTENDPEKEIEL